MVIQKELASVLSMAPTLAPVSLSGSGASAASRSALACSKAVAPVAAVLLGAEDTAADSDEAAGAEETAVGATIVKTEYENMLERGDRDVVISSCCHSINLLIQKYYPQLLPYLADVVSPMQAHCLASHPWRPRRSPEP